MRISDWSSDVCSSDLFVPINPLGRYGGKKQFGRKSAGTPLCGAAAAYIGHDPRSLRQTRIPSDRDGPNRQFIRHRGGADLWDFANKEAIIADRKSTRLNSSH